MAILKAVGARPHRPIRRKRRCTLHIQDLYRHVYLLREKRWFWANRFSFWVNTNKHEWSWWGDGYRLFVLEDGIPF